MPSAFASLRAAGAASPLGLRSARAQAGHRRLAHSRGGGGSGGAGMQVIDSVRDFRAFRAGLAKVGIQRPMPRYCLGC